MSIMTSKLKRGSDFLETSVFRILNLWFVKELEMVLILTTLRDVVIQLIVASDKHI